jgi:hypothetical protein
MIEHQVHSSAFASLPEYGQSDCGFSNLEASKYIYRCGNVGTSTFDREVSYMWQILLIQLQYRY